MQKNLLIIIIFTLLFSCASPPTSPSAPLDNEFENTVFVNTILIETGLPEFASITDSVPTFTWRVTGNKLVFLSIFNENIELKNNRITNIQDIIWAWHSGTGNGRAGNIQFSDGYDVQDGNLLVEQRPTPLTSGNSYVWAIWAWDDEGKKITHSSQEMFFIVE